MAIFSKHHPIRNTKLTSQTLRPVPTPSNPSWFRNRSNTPSDPSKVLGQFGVVRRQAKSGCLGFAPRNRRKRRNTIMIQNSRKGDLPIGNQHKNTLFAKPGCHGRFSPESWHSELRTPTVWHSVPNETLCLARLVPSRTKRKCVLSSSVDLS